MNGSEEELEEWLDKLRDARRPLRTSPDSPRMYIYQLNYNDEEHDFRIIHIDNEPDFRLVLGEVPDVDQAWVLNHIKGTPEFGHNHLFEDAVEAEKKILEVITREKPYYCECSNPEVLKLSQKKKCKNCLRPVKEEEGTP